MAKTPRKRPEVPTEVVRRPASERKRLPPELEAFARSDEKRLRGKPRSPRLNDPRDVALVPGVANRDARQVFEARIEALGDAAKDRESPEGRARLARLLAEAYFLGLWRGRSITGFDVMVDALLEIPADEARQLAEAGADALDLELDQATEEAVAIWFRADAALLEAGQEARISPYVNEEGEECLRIDVTVARGPDALHAIGRRLTPLVRDREAEREAAEKRKREWEEREAKKKRRGTLED